MVVEARQERMVTRSAREAYRVAEGFALRYQKEISCVVDSTKIVYLQLKDNKDE